jgi:NAD(P)-dependent dehydrogenase (short-subunit alcohol dehydrogenase family)
MARRQKTAYITGAASGIARAVAEMLVARGIKVAIADMNFEGVKTVAAYLNQSKESTQGGEGSTGGANVAFPFELNASDWDSQLRVFNKALEALGGRIDLVYPIAGIGERVSIPNDGGQGEGFKRPDLSVLDVDLYGFIYTTSLAVQQMRRQGKDGEGFRGKSKFASLLLVYRWLVGLREKWVGG